MNGNMIISNVFLGTGGPQPGLWVVGREGRSPMPLVQLGAGHSVYAVDVDAEEGMIAIGTRAGGIELFSCTETSETSAPQVLGRLYQGAPVLSVCLLDEGRLASTDTAGRCLLWDPPGRSAAPQALEVEEERICSVLRLPDGRLAGLSSEGRLLLWDVANGHLLGALDVPTPPGKLALVRLCYWPAHHAAVYPASDGRLVVCELSPPQVHAHPSHSGGFYVCIVDGSSILTVGRNDGLAKVWDCTGGPPCQQHPVPRGIISGEVLGVDSGQVLLVSERGEASVYSLESRSLRELHRLDGTQYRTVVGAAPLIRELFRQEQRVAKARDLRIQIQTRMASNQCEDMADLHGQLTRLGFERVSLALRAQHAAQKQDLIGELRTRHQLAGLLPSDSPSSVNSLCRHAAVLEAAWRLVEAQRAYNRISAPEAEGASRDWLERAAEIVQGDDWVIEANISIPLLIEAASVTETPFAGRWVLDVARPVIFRDGTLSAGELAAKYEEVVAKDGRGGLPHAEVRTLWWLSREMIRRTEAVILDRPPGESAPGPRMLFELRRNGIQILTVASLVFDVGPPEQNLSWNDHNEHVRAVYERLSRVGVLTPWFREVHRVMNNALRPLRTQALSAGLR